MGVKFPPMENIENSCDNNPDGFAITWAIDGVLRNYRTLKQKAFLKKCREVFKLDYKKTACVIHARIATHGTIKLANTHCWIDEPTAMAFAHNGILSLSNRDDMTDSETFFRDIFLPIYSVYGWDKAELAINACIGTSKFAFLKANGELRVFGNYNELKGVLYSNTTYLARTTYWGGFGSTKTYRDSIWNPLTKTFVYRGTETDAEWEALKDDIDANIFWDWNIRDWRYRNAETDEEWELLRLESDEARKKFNSSWNHYDY
jgi:hypothetical protein